MGKKIQFVFLLFLTATLSSGAFAEERQPAVAGTFYPADSTELRQLVEAQLRAANQSTGIDGRIVALIVPHAGLVYSGPVAANAYRLLEGSGTKHIVLVGPSHHYAFHGISVYGPGVVWKTPLGSVPCDDALCRQLIESDKEISVIPQAQEHEHSLEVQLPFLQSVLHDFSIVPVTMGSQDRNAINILADALSKLPDDRQTIIVASTDLQHYRPASEGRLMDSLSLACIESLNSGRLERLLSEGKTEMCGGGPAAAVVQAAVTRGANNAKIVKYGDSGDAFGDKSRVVGYAAVVLYQSSDTHSEDNNQHKGAVMLRNEKESDKSSHLSDGEKKQLLTIARQSINTYLKTGRLPEFDVSGVLAAPGAAFVTLKKGGQLRGCIGQTVAGMPLYKTVSTCAVHSALDDPRFPAVSIDEVDKLEIEISVLTPLEPLESFDSIQIGRDGLMITKGNYHGLLLPQVATEYGWNPTQFLEYTCQKAGLPKEAYKMPGATIYRFQAVVFGE